MDNCFLFNYYHVQIRPLTFFRSCAINKTVLVAHERIIFSAHALHANVLLKCIADIVRKQRVGYLDAFSGLIIR